MIPPEHYYQIHQNHCVECGQCLKNCPYLGITSDQAVSQIKLLKERSYAPLVLKKCFNCMACNYFCPQGLYPYELILLQRYFRYQQQGGIPERATYLLPHFSPHFRSDLIQDMWYRERELLKSWFQTYPEGELVLYPGCNLLALPSLADTMLLEGVVITGNWKLCCGEMYYRMGLFETVSMIAERLTEYYKDKNIGTMLFACPACYRMFSQVLPSQFGAHFPFQSRFLGNYLLEQIKIGEIPIKSSPEKKPTLQDSCHGRLLGNKFMQEVRSLLTTVGVTSYLDLPSKSSGQGFCCGIAASAKRFRPEDILRASLLPLQEAKKQGAEEILVYCSGCYLNFSLWNRFLPGAPRITHWLEHLQEAVDEKNPPPIKRRTKRLLYNSVKEIFPKLFSRNTVKVEDFLPSSLD